MILRRRLASLVPLLALAPVFCAPSLHAQDWFAPTAAELTMTSVPEAPGASAIILYREEDTLSYDQVTNVYLRIKVLNDSGKEFANVELPYNNGDDGVDYDKLAGRTIHPDGTIIPFTGKPYEKLIEKDQGVKYKAKMFTLPSVDVGSIIEFRYRRVFRFSPIPDWFVQSEMFTRKAHFSWRLGINDTEPIAFTPILPPGVAVVKPAKYGAPFVLDVENIAPQPKEEMMPPVGSLSYRVLFYDTAYKTWEEFWKDKGEYWSKSLNEFIGPHKGVTAAVAALTSPTDSDDEKIHKIYATIMGFENTDFTRQLTAREAKVQGQKELKTTDDILARKSGNSAGLTFLFVSMARAAGLKAYIMRVSDRSERLFMPAYLSTSQADNYIAIVNIKGVDTWFDPGERYCPYAQLAWYHALAGGQRQTDTGTALAKTPGGDYKNNHVDRIADLTLDDKGNASGKVAFTYKGDLARRWRQRALTTDDTGLKTELRSNLVDLLPSGMEVTVTSTGDLTHFDTPLIITYDIQGPIGSSTGKRLIVPANLFQVNIKPRFIPEKREVSVDLRLGSITQDAVRYKYPPTLSIESAPPPSGATLKQDAGFNTSTAPGKGEVTFYRNLGIAQIIYPIPDYPDLRAFYQKMEAHDQDSLIFTRTPPSP